MVATRQRRASAKLLSTRERIEREAITILSEKGYDAASMREIAEASGVSKPVVYYYFKSKEMLCHHLISAGLEEFRRLQREVCSEGSNDSAGDLLEQIVRMVQARFDFCLDNLEFMRFIYALNFGPDRKKIDYDFHGFGDEMSDMLTGLMRRASEAGLIRKGKEEAAAHYLRGIVSAYVMPYMDGHEEFPPGLARTIVTDMVSGLGT